MYLQVDSLVNDHHNLNTSKVVTQSSTTAAARIPVQSSSPGRFAGRAAGGRADIPHSEDSPIACTPEEIFYYTQYNSSSAATARLYHPIYEAGAPYYPDNNMMMGSNSQYYYDNQQTPFDARTFSSTVDQNGPGRPDRIDQVMSFHPQYLKIFNKSQAFVMRGDGPLPFHYRNYIAIMAAGRHQCSYLIEQQVSEFLQQGGDERWLSGLGAIPTKLRDLYELNKILAHRPWLITKNHIEKLTKGSDSWSLGELVHALVILAHFHAISTFVFGCGIGDGEEEPPCLIGDDGQILPGQHSPAASTASAPSSTPSAPGSPSDPGSHLKDHHQFLTPGSIPHGSGRGSPENFGKSSASNGGGNNSSGPNSRRSTMASGEECPNDVGLDALMRRMKSLAERRQEFTAEEQTKRYQHVESQSAELGLTPTAAGATRPKPEISQFIDDPDFVYQDFARRGEVNSIPTFRVQDYSWDDHAYSLMSRLYCDSMGNLLDDKFRLMYQLTYNTLGGKKDVDTSRFRTAIWNYIQCMFGIRHDDYDYGEVNQVLERSLKAYIKMTVCFPERVTRQDYDSVLKEFHHSEKIHVNLMMLEARIQAELLYALRAIMRHMT